MTSLKPHVEKLLNQRYYKKGENWPSLVTRVVNNVCQDEPDNYKEIIHNYIYNRIFIPNSPCLANAGSRSNGLFACFVAGPSEDSLEVHLETLKDIAQVAKAGGGCFGAEHQVLTKNGRKSIAEVDLGEFVYSYNMNTKEMQFQRVIATHTNPMNSGEIVYINTGNRKGVKSFRSSYNHPYLVWQGSEIKEVWGCNLKKGDVLISSSSWDTKLSREYWAKGYITGDGAVEKQPNGYGYRIRITTINNLSVARFSELPTADIHVSDRKSEKNTPTWEISIYKKYAENIANDYNFIPTQYTKHIPNSVWMADAHEKLSYIVGMLDSDGHFDNIKNRYSLWTVSEQLALDTSALLSSLGIKSSMRCKASVKENEQPIFEVIVESSLSFNAAVKEISVKYGKIINVSSNKKYSQNRINVDKDWLLPIIWERTHLSKSKKRRYVSLDNRSYNLSLLYSHGQLPKETLEVILRDYNYSDIANLIRGGIVVYGVDKSKEQDNLYDLTIENNHTYMVSSISNEGYVSVHNCGFTGTFIRPENSPVAGSAHGYAYGPCNYILKVNDYMDMMTQAGFRRMALMATLRSDHPDLDKFIELKQSGDEGKGALFNQSIMAQDEWMQDAIDNPNGISGKQLKKVAENAWNNGEPGLLFHTTINENTPYKTCGCVIEASNPCGEQLIPEYGSCNLGSINIAHEEFYDMDSNFMFSKLYDVVKNAIQFLDNVGIHNKFPNKKFENWYKDHRPVGLGLMGYSDALLKLNMTYGQEDALNFLESILETMYNAALEKSEELGEIRGIPNHCKKLNRRNATLLSIAPTGSISFIADCSSSIEPIFAPTFTRTDERGETYNFELPTAILPYFKSAINDDPNKVVSWKEHVATQIVAQKWVDSGISKTINFPESATVEEVYEAMVYAWENKAKGITVYRNNSRFKQVLTTNSKDLDENRTHVKRPKSLPCTIHSLKINGDKWLLVVGLLDDKPYEIFALKYALPVKSKDGTITKVKSKIYNLVTPTETIEDITAFNTDEEAALTRMISLHLRAGTSLKFIVEQLTKSEGVITSFSKAVNRVLAKYTNEVNLKCEDCGSKNLISQSGCFVCVQCGSSKCG